MADRMSEAKRQQLRELIRDGASHFEAAAVVGCYPKSVFRLLRPYKGKPPRRRSSRQLSIAEREEISRSLSQEGESLRSIARRLKRSQTTVSREVAANGGRQKYRAYEAEFRAEQLCRRPKPRKLQSSPELISAIEQGLLKRWSPQQISKRLRVDHPARTDMRVSHETIYKNLYLQGRGSLRKALTTHLRTQRLKRKHQGRSTGRLRDMVMISERPASVKDRAVPGHWEGDLIVGTDSKSSIGTLVERTTRFVMLLHLPIDHTATRVRDALTAKIQQLPAELRRSLTWDQGNELAQHAQFTVDTGVKVFFCDPHSPWQRGSNENTNGLLRQYFPKGTDLRQHSAEELDQVAAELNGRPRQTLNWRTPSEVLNNLLR